ncbi:MAG: adenosine kinase [Fibrobacteraceae bacterium]|nr:adenosine kinase [Fibrobacteraceae bacterium]
MKRIVGVGAALVDLLVNVQDSWIQENKAVKGDMQLVDFSRIESLLSTLPAYEKVPGGSACNTLVGYAKLGGEAAFVSKTGEDELGKLFALHLKNSNVQSLIKPANEPTGRVLSVVTPDAERTMFSYLGASDTLSLDDFPENVFDGAALTYIEGYRAFDAKTFRGVLERSKAAGVPTALDFGSFGVVNVCHSLFESLFAEGLIDMIFANEEEAKAYTGKEPREALEELAKYTSLAVVKLGAEGALVSYQGTVFEIKAKKVQALDTTGAGDLWAAGFLFGFLSGSDIPECGKLASEVAAEVVQVQGASIPDSVWNRLKNL